MIRAAVMALALFAPFATPAIAAPETAEVAVLANPVMRGDLLNAGDFVVEERPVSASRGALDIQSASGMEAKRSLGPGSIVRVTDIVTPRLVHRGEPVLIVVKRAGLVITGRGRALGSAGAGEAVRVVADATNRTLDGTVGPDGSVLVGG
ncbi:flagellar basal body P-ring formation chaperone FlgA [Stakelama sp. CBK3Z-3]|uniref:Flagella basal body P-ring formation protein FlgA n=1 Tax=Stakelama flava TaxID=2860338 RepID=A0ABS6XJS0_9SPHN|nr:flagellar basal body P-ring formation chaperone FlgA [Stakelama flava]MBW4330457.1 flagellar basal body P-ring formation chaperone FlgA [Stakelama flava]